MLYSLFYVSTLILLTLSSLGVSRALGLQLENIFVLLIILCVVASLVIASALRLGARWPHWSILPIGLLGLTHLTSISFPLPGLIIIGFNLFFFVSSWYLSKKITDQVP